MNIQSLYETSLKDLKRKLVNEIGKDLGSVVLYGSVASNKATKDSDIDVMIITNNASGIRDKVSEIRYENDLKHGTLTTLIFMKPGYFERLGRAGDPFIRNIISEGVLLYGRRFTERHNFKAFEAG